MRSHLRFKLTCRIHSEATDPGRRPRITGPLRARNSVRVVACLVGLALGPMGYAATHEPNIDASPAPTESVPGAVVAIEQLRLSNLLADFGERHADPVALIEAAKIRKMLPATFRPPKDAGPGMRTWESLLRRAEQFSGGSPALPGLIADVRAYKQREVPTVGDDVRLLHKLIKQKSADRAEVRFKAGEVAIVYIQPDSGSNLVLFVYDEFNNLICSGDSASHEALCRWRPRWDGVFLLDVRNDTTADVSYQLAINREIVAH
jgi:hypothetical protein